MFYFGLQAELVALGYVGSLSPPRQQPAVIPANLDLLSFDHLT